jgi:DNA-binding response OmpR family regulator
MEDEPSLAQGLKMVLSKQGYEVDLADTGLRALGSLGTKNFDLLVADLMLPDVDGMEVLRTVKETKPETQIIVITGYATVPYRRGFNETRGSGLPGQAFHYG